MFKTRTQRVVFASGILFVLTLAIFGSLIAVAWMSMNNTMDVSADRFDGTAQVDATQASRHDSSECQEYGLSLDFKYTISSSPDASGTGPISDYDPLWNIVRLTH